jgi:hypothetical protein
MSGSCKKQSVTPQSELSKLPSATQIGANTIGCLVNGQALLPAGNSFSGPITQCHYIYTNGGYYFTVQFSNIDNRDLIKTILIRTQSIAIHQDQTIIFKSSAIGNADALYAIITSNGDDNKYVTTATVSGQFVITKLDTLKQIVSGTFNFNAVNNSNDTVKVTNGRFDMPYTR